MRLYDHFVKAYTNMNPKLRIAGWMLAGAFVGAFSVVQIQAIARNPVDTIPVEQIREFANAYGLIQAGYVEPTDGKTLIENAISGMVERLDPHSQYLNAEEFAEFMNDTTGKFVGLGIEITEEDGYVKIISPIEDSPAFRAGLQPGDLITRIDGTETRELTLQQAVQRMRGEPNTSVTLTIYRKSDNRTFTVTIVRAEIHTRSVKAAIIEPGYGWIRISQFQENTVEAFIQKLNELYQQDPDLKGLVLDLRNDPGGLLSSAIAISAIFLPEDALVVSTKGQNPEVEINYLANPLYYVPGVKPPTKTQGKDGENMSRALQTAIAYANRNDPLRALPPGIKDIPLIVLVNEGSASASEIVAGALQDHGRAIIMGATTFGKGSVQTTMMLSENTALKMTIALYYTPSDKSIQATGIIPDIFLAEYADGTSPFSALYSREADLQRHLVVNDENQAEQQRSRQDREEAIQRFQNTEENALPRMPEFGSAEDFRLRQALNQLQGKPVISINPNQGKTDDDVTQQTPVQTENVPVPERLPTSPLIRERILAPDEQIRLPQ